MTSSTETLKTQFDLQTQQFNNTLDGISDSEAESRNSDRINHMKFIAGHLLEVRVNLITQMTGSQPDTTYAAQFGYGVALDPNASYTPIEEIRSKWNNTATAISGGIIKIPEETLASKSPIPVPVADDTLLGLLSFLINHEAYHIGQLGLLRKMAGKEAMSYQ